jgi:hypothetical protein
VLSEFAVRKVAELSERRIGIGKLAGTKAHWPAVPKTKAAQEVKRTIHEDHFLINNESKPKNLTSRIFRE